MAGLRQRRESDVSVRLKILMAAILIAFAVTHIVAGLELRAANPAQPPSPAALTHTGD
jgi:hypothetical protein